MEKILSFIDDMGLIAFKKDAKTQNALTRNFEGIREASKNIPDEIKIQYPEVPWNKMYGLRNIVSY